MFYVGNTYMCMPSSYIGGQPTSGFGFNVRFTRTNDVLLTTCIGEGTSNPRHLTTVDKEEEAENEENKGGAKNKEGSKIDDDLI